MRHLLTTIMVVAIVSVTFTLMADNAQLTILQLKA